MTEKGRQRETEKGRQRERQRREDHDRKRETQTVQYNHLSGGAKELAYLQLVFQYRHFFVWSWAKLSPDSRVPGHKHNRSVLTP